MADETLKPKRSPVKQPDLEVAVQDAKRPAGRPDLKFIESILGTLDAEQRDVYENGYWDDDPKRGALTADDIRIYEKARVDARRQFEATIRLRQVRAEQARAREAARLAARNPADYTCTGCKEEFEYLTNATVKLCLDCAQKKMEADEAAFAKNEAARKAQEIEARKTLTPEQCAEMRRKWRVEYQKAHRRIKRSLWLLNKIQGARRKRDSFGANPAAQETVKRLRAYIDRWERMREQWTERAVYTEDGYTQMKQQDAARRAIHPEYRYCRNDGLPIAWERHAFYCDDKCETAVRERGEAAVDMGAECVACGARLTGASAAEIAALPTYDESVFHTWECLMSSEEIDEDDYTAYGPDAACWKPLLHHAAVKPAWTLAERKRLILSSPEKILALTGGPTAKALLTEGPKALPGVSPMSHATLALPSVSETQLQQDDNRMLDWAARFNGGYFTLVQARTGTGKGWIATGRVRPTIDRLVVAKRLIAHPGLPNRWKLAERNGNA